MITRIEHSMRSVEAKEITLQLNATSPAFVCLTRGQVSKYILISHGQQNSPMAVYHQPLDSGVGRSTAFAYQRVRLDR